jgi:hypothetical protein
MAIRTALTFGLVFHVATASAQLSPSTFGGIPLWADSALRTAGLDQRFTLTSKLNPVYAFGDFDRDGLVDIAVEVKDAGGLGCGIAITHRIDRSVHIVGAGKPVGNGKSQVACGRWGVTSAGQADRHAKFDHDLLYATDPGAHSGWLVWDGHTYVWIEAD